MPQVHSTAKAGYTARAGVYVSGRPGYPPEVDDWLRHMLELAPGRTVLDLGAGTGKFLPHLLETGAGVIAVEPVDAMRAELSAAYPSVRALEGSAEAIPLPAESVDAIVCAQAFHWFASAATLAEMRRVLKPGGMLGLIWNVRDESVGWVARLSAITDPHSGDAPRYRTGEWRRQFPADGVGLRLELQAASHLRVRRADVDGAAFDRLVLVEAQHVRARRCRTGAEREEERGREDCSGGFHDAVSSQ